MSLCPYSVPDMVERIAEIVRAEPGLTFAEIYSRVGTVGGEDGVPLDNQTDATIANRKARFDDKRR